MSIENPIVAVIGSTGYAGKGLMPAFLDALKENKLKELRVLTSQGQLERDTIKGYGAAGAKLVEVNLKHAPEVANALSGVDVVVSALGTGEGIDDVKTAVLEALVQANVKIYFPSEFGTNHYKVSNHNHPIFDGKRKHFLQAKEKGLKAIRMFIGLIMEASFGKWFGLDCVTGVWNVVEGGADIPCAVTSLLDIGRFTLEAVLLACDDSSSCPDEFEVYSDLKTLREYAKALEKESRNTITIENIPQERLQNDFKETQEFEKLLMLLFGLGTHDYSKSTGNELLNSNQSKWKPKMFEEYAKETEGVPWRDYMND